MLVDDLMFISSLLLIPLCPSSLVSVSCLSLLTSHVRAFVGIFCALYLIHILLSHYPGFVPALSPTFDSVTIVSIRQKSTKSPPLISYS